MHISEGNASSCAGLIITEHSGNLLIALNSIASFTCARQIMFLNCHAVVAYNQIMQSMLVSFLAWC